MGNVTNGFKDVYRPIQDPDQKIARWYTRDPFYFYLRYPETDFDDDIIFELPVEKGFIWDIAISCDSTDWNFMLFTEPNQIAGDYPSGDDMVHWAPTFIFTTGEVLSQFYEYQSFLMSPLYFHHREGAPYPKNLYGRFLKDVNLTKADIKMVISTLY
jgi:hypothetical protein